MRFADLGSNDRKGIAVVTRLAHARSEMYRPLMHRLARPLIPDNETITILLYINGGVIAVRVAG